MSRVRNAMKIADVWPGQSFTLQGGPLPQPAEAVTCEAPEAVEVEESYPVLVSLPKAPVSFSGRLLRRVKRLLRIRTGAVVPRCNGFTRTGLACRAPSMLNGYCRMHGGSRKLLS